MLSVSRIAENLYRVDLDGRTFVRGEEVVGARTAVVTDRANVEAMRKALDDVLTGRQAGALVRTPASPVPALDDIDPEDLA